MRNKMDMNELRRLVYELTGIESLKGPPTFSVNKLLNGSSITIKEFGKENYQVGRDIYECLLDKDTTLTTLKILKIFEGPNPNPTLEPMRINPLYDAFTIRVRNVSPFVNFQPQA